MSNDDLIVPPAFIEVIDERLHARLRELGIDPAAIGQRGERIQRLERALEDQARKIERLERYADRARTTWIVLRWIAGLSIPGGALYAAISSWT